MAKLRIGVIGCGLVAQVMHLPHLRELGERYEVAMLCDLSPVVVRDVGDYYGIERRTTDWRELVAAPEIDAVLICTPGSHAEAAIAAANAGKHVLAEKPMCLSLAQADAMVAAADRAGVTLMVAYMKRYDPGYRHARALIRDLRDIRYVQVNVLHPSQAPNFAHHHLLHVGREDQFTLDRMDPASLAEVHAAIGDVPAHVAWNYASVLLGSIIHDISALNGLFGPPDEVLLTELWDHGKSLTTTFRYGDGVRAVLTWTFLAELRHYDEEIAVLADAARVRIRFPSPYFRNMPTPIVIEGMEGEANWTKTLTVSYEEAFKQELIHFHACVTTGATPETDGHAGRQDIAVGLDIYDAYARRVGLPPAQRS